MIITLEIIVILLSYLLGSIPIGYLLTHYSTGENILKHGSGNVGSTNVGRIAGKRIATLTQVLDMSKGLIPVALYFFFMEDMLGAPEYYVYLLALATILGHDFSIFLKFNGGKGVNTTLGASVLIAPYSVFLSVAIYYMVRLRFKYVSTSSLILGISLPLSEYIFYGISSTFYYLLICMALIILRHKENIKRLMQHQELES